MHMMRKGQVLLEDCIELSFAEQFIQWQFTERMAPFPKSGSIFCPAANAALQL
jgi:hypothetical protein